MANSLRRPLVGLFLLAATAHGQGRASEARNKGGSDPSVFGRLVALVGQPKAALDAEWPTKIETMQSPVRLTLTPARTVTVYLGRSQMASDTTMRVLGVAMEELVPDTISLQQTVLLLQGPLVATLGAADRCSSSLATPADLFAPQSSVAFWTRGRGGHPTSVRWDVSPDRAYRIRTAVGQFTDSELATQRCDVTLR